MAYKPSIYSDINEYENITSIWLFAFVSKLKQLPKCVCVCVCVCVFLCEIERGGGGGGSVVRPNVRCLVGS